MTDDEMNFSYLVTEIRKLRILKENRENTIARLERANKIMKEALEYYGSMIAVCRHDDSSWCDHCPDGGKRARQALKDCEGL